ncbi:hypothetical protein Ssi03_45830 [Sphaerisporangium siamense]|uniref:Uncharacterized protein n=1 Tax=Sphaerisporangium siamense TaxID=795645 RepID=A0A7W7DE85_9ACTN|nr:hypothetical protein [Sphaerisporangium siamense]MBB4705255.1 hypothetical protein [Sphaerisporangium siamense]GII86593.1 hypothetical protein Ssi03_45830 [Sphaerisporangium siamense]
MIDDPVPATSAVPFDGASLKEVSDEAVAAFLGAGHDSRQVIEFRHVGNTVVVHSRSWKNVVYNFRKDVQAVLGAAGMVTAPFFTEPVTGVVITGVLACLNCWHLLASTRKIELAEPHALLVSRLSVARLAGQDGNPAVLRYLTAEFQAKGWDLDSVIDDLQSMRILAADRDRQRLVLRDRILITRRPTP